MGQAPCKVLPSLEHGPKSTFADNDDYDDTDGDSDDDTDGDTEDDDGDGDLLPSDFRLNHKSAEPGLIHIYVFIS